MKTYITAITLSVLLLSLPVVFAGEVTGLTSFSAGTLLGTTLTGVNGFELHALGPSGLWVSDTLSDRGSAVSVSAAARLFGRGCSADM